jgi:hypothetical protein
MTGDLIKQWEGKMTDKLLSRIETIEWILPIHVKEPYKKRPFSVHNEVRYLKKDRTTFLFGTFHGGPDCNGYAASVNLYRNLADAHGKERIPEPFDPKAAKAMMEEFKQNNQWILVKLLTKTYESGLIVSDVIEVLDPKS